MNGDLFFVVARIPPGTWQFYSLDGVGSPAYASEANARRRATEALDEVHEYVELGVYRFSGEGGLLAKVSRPLPELVVRSPRLWTASGPPKGAPGYEGDPCRECGMFMLTRNGTCLKCESCGASNGCS